MSATLWRKLLRDLAQMRAQGAAIAVVIAAGVMTLVVTVTSLDAISLSQERFYRDYGFADVFAELRRAPESVAERVRAVDGVNSVDTRVQAPVRVAVPGYRQPVSGQLISLPDGQQPLLNRLHLRTGRLPASGRNDEVVVSEPFAEAHALRAGDTLQLVIKGRLERLRVTGVALSPEWIYQIGPADLMPDYERFGVLWMNRRALAEAFDMEGAFNSLAISLQAGAAPEAAIDAVDAILARYGGVGAYGREDQISHRFLSEELSQLRIMATVLPAIFLGVAAFLLNVLTARIIGTQRQQIAVLKAFGYRNRDMALYYGLLTLAVVLIGAAAGSALGAWAAEALAGLYTEYFRFPQTSFRLQPWVLALGVGVAALAALAGTFRAVRGAVRLPPAESMRPPQPERFGQGPLVNSRLVGLLDQPTRIILRNLARFPMKTALSVLGVAMAGALLLVGNYQFAAMDALMDQQYRLVQKMDIVLHFSEPTSEKALAELRHEPGVRHAEGFRNVAVRLRNGHRSYRTSIQGMEAEPALRGLVDEDGRRLRLPDAGLMMTDYLAEHLGLQVGDNVRVAVMEGHRRELAVPLAAVVSEPLGVSAYMERRALNRLMREGPALSGAWLMTTSDREQALYDSLWEIPRVAGVGLIAESARELRAYIATTVLVVMGLLLVLAGAIAFAVVYNNARISFSERARELATLRVLGFSRGEVAWILVGEILLLVLLAIPLGWLIGTGLAALLSNAMSIDMYRIPFVITPASYGIATLGVLLATALSVALILRRLQRMDMLSALQAAE